MTESERLERCERVLRTAEALLSGWERALDPHSPLALLLADIRRVLPVEVGA